MFLTEYIQLSTFKTHDRIELFDFLVVDKDQMTSIETMWSILMKEFWAEVTCATSRRSF